MNMSMFRKITMAPPKDTPAVPTDKSESKPALSFTSLAAMMNKNKPA